MDVVVIAAIYNIATFAASFINPESISFPHPLLYPFARFAVWALYTFFTGLFATGLWVVAHECGHQAFSDSKMVNNSVGWVLHSAYVFHYVFFCFSALLTCDRRARARFLYT